MRQLYKYRRLTNNLHRTGTGRGVLKWFCHYFSALYTFIGLVYARHWYMRPVPRGGDVSLQAFSFVAFFSVVFPLGVYQLVDLKEEFGPYGPWQVVSEQLNQSLERTPTNSGALLLLCYASGEVGDHSSFNTSLGNARVRSSICSVTRDKSKQPPVCWSVNNSKNWAAIS